MAARDTSALLRFRKQLTQRFQIRNASVVYHGAMAALGSPTHATSANRGRISPFTGAAGEIPVGLILPGPNVDRDGYTGDTSESPVPDAEVAIGGGVLEDVGVAGASAVTDCVGSLVYLNDTDNPSADLTLTRPTRGVPQGIVVAYRSGDNCDVYLFSMAEIYIIGLTGNGQELMHLGHFDANTVANGDLRTAIPMPFRGRFLEVFAMIDEAVAGAGATASINLEIDGTNVTGGVVTVAENDAKGTKKAGTAITAANVFSEGSTVDVEAASVTDASAGSFDLYAIVERLPGS